MNQAFARDQNSAAVLSLVAAEAAAHNVVAEALAPCGLKRTCSESGTPGSMARSTLDRDPEPTSVFNAGGCPHWLIIIIMRMMNHQN